MTSTPFALTLTRDVSAPRIARHILNEWFATALAHDEFDTAELLVSELVTNAVLHGQGTIMVRAHLVDGDGLLVEVMDEGTGFERPVRDADFEKIGGWGLGLVDSESSRWGGTRGHNACLVRGRAIRAPARSREETSASRCMNGPTRLRPTLGCSCQFAGGRSRVSGAGTPSAISFARSISAFTSAPNSRATLVSHSQTSRMIAAANEPYVTLKLLKLAR